MCDCDAESYVSTLYANEFKSSQTLNLFDRQFLEGNNGKPVRVFC